MCVCVYVSKARLDCYGNADLVHMHADLVWLQTVHVCGPDCTCVWCVEVSQPCLEYCDNADLVHMHAAGAAISKGLY